MRVTKFTCYSGLSRQGLKGKREVPESERAEDCPALGTPRERLGYASSAVTSHPTLLDFPEQTGRKPIGILKTDYTDPLHLQISSL